MPQGPEHVSAGRSSTVWTRRSCGLAPYEEQRIMEGSFHEVWLEQGLGTSETKVVAEPIHRKSARSEMRQLCEGFAVNVRALVFLARSVYVGYWICIEK